MSMTPNGQAAMQSRQPLQASRWMYTVSNSVRMMAPVGHTSRQPALHAVLAHVGHHQPAALARGPALNCSMNLTCRQLIVELARCCRSCRRDSGADAAVGRRAAGSTLAGHLARLAADADVVSVKNPTGSAMAITPSPRCTRRPCPRGSSRSGRHQGRQLVDDVAGAEALVAPVPGHARRGGRSCRRS